MESRAKQIALVTGANKGIGFEVARQLAASGCIVLLGAPDETLGKEAAGKLAAGNLDVRFVPIDVTELSTITAAAENISRDFGRLDILVNNAGINDPADGPALTAHLDAVERVLRTNFLALWRLRKPCCRCCATRRLAASSTSRVASALLPAAPAPIRPPQT